MESREALRSKGDQSLHLPLSERRNARNVGYFRKPLCIQLRLGRSLQSQRHKMADEESVLPEPAYE